jgi:hypothetical protein
MPSPRLRPCLAAALLLLAGCASAPPPPREAPPPRPFPILKPPSPTALPPPEPLRLFCGESASHVAWKSLNLPQGEDPVDVALTPRYVWVLFQPARLLRFDRTSGSPTAAPHVEMKLGPPGEVWTGIDADPLDGSVWVVTEEFVFHQISPDLRMTTVPLQRKVVGKSGFGRLLAAPDALYAAPICGDYGIWRIDRKGKVLGTSFPVEHRPDEVLNPDTMPCAEARIERDLEGRILAMKKGGQVFRAEPSGAWTAIETDLLRAAPARAVRGTRYGKQRRGQPGEYYYAAGYLDALFFWKGRPVFFGAPNPQAQQFVVATFVMPDPANAADPKAAKRLPARCGPEGIVDVATDETGYAAITPGTLFFGDFASAPDLP